MASNCQRRLNLALACVTLWLLAGCTPGGRPAIEAGQPEAAWILDSTYSEMDQGWGFFALRYYVSQSQDTLRRLSS